MKYFDYAATCPLSEEASLAYVKTATEYFGNSSSLHDIGSTASQLLENCRKELAQLLGVPKEGMFFTSGGSESNYLGVMSLLPAKKKEGNHIITGLAEHSSIQGTFEKLKENGYEITYLPFNQEGLIDLEMLKNSIREDTILISLQYVNPEIGTIQPIEEIGKICKENRILLHSDCVQAFGKLDFKELTRWLDSFSISGHKIYGPKGIGAIFVDPFINWQSYYRNASHENGFRPGTLNVPAIVSMTVAAQSSYRLLNTTHSHYKHLRQVFLEKLHFYRDQVIIYDLPDSHQLPSTLGMRIKGKEGQWVMLECNRMGYCLSTGSACQTGMKASAKTMKAMGIPDKEGKEFIRISFGKDTTEEDTIGLANAMITIINQ